MPHLADDECRCHDDGCPQHEQCLRWVDRNYGTNNKLYSHSPSLFPYDQPLGTWCPLRIEATAR